MVFSTTTRTLFKLLGTSSVAVLVTTSVTSENIYVQAKSRMTSVSNHMFNNKIHVKALTSPYGQEKIQRFKVPVDKIPWDVPYPEYRPPNYTLQGIADKKFPWADPDKKHQEFKAIQWHNPEDGHPPLDRSSFEARYEIIDDYPRNPIGRTGLKGRGVLGRWGPNHAADPIVTRWKRDRRGTVVLDKSTQKPILQFVAIRRRDNKEWAIPGGMVEAGHTVSKTLIDEFSEEAYGILDKNKRKKEAILAEVEKFFLENGEEVYKGYVDDPRNTDNAWMETVAMNFHDETGTFLGKFSLSAGDDAGKVKWEDISGNLNLYASHIDFVKKVAEIHKAHW